MGWAMLSKSLIRFSLHEWGCVPSLLFDLRPNYSGGNEDSDGLLQWSYACTAALSAPTLHQASADQHLLWRLLDTPGQVWVSLLWGHCSFLLGPSAHKLLFALFKSPFPQSCVNSGGSKVELICHTWVCHTQSPCPCRSPLLTHTSSGDTQTQFSFSLCGVSGSWCTQGLFEPSNILLLIVFQQQVVILELLQDRMSAHLSTPSWALDIQLFSFIFDNFNFQCNLLNITDFNYNYYETTYKMFSVLLNFLIFFPKIYFNIKIMPSAHSSYH